MRPKLLKEKPMTEEEKRKLNEAARLLANWLEKRDIENHFKCSERQARDMVSTIAKKVPVIASSERKGYKRAMTVNDLELAKVAAAELGSRIKELFARKKPLDEFIKKYETEEESDG